MSSLGEMLGCLGGGLLVDWLRARHPPQRGFAAPEARRVIAGRVMLRQHCPEPLVLSGSVM